MDRRLVLLYFLMFYFTVFVTSNHCRMPSRKCYCELTKISCSGELTSEEISALYEHISENTTSVRLSQQEFTEFDVCKLKNITKLIELNLNYNLIENYPKNLNTCGKDIEILYMRFNRLKKFESIGTALQVKSLWLDTNQFKNIPKNSFTDFPQLQTLLITSCQIEEIKEGAFNGLQNVKKIELNTNRITKINAEVFSPMSSIKAIYLKTNNIKSLSPKAFANLNLEILDLRENEIERITKDAFYNTNIQELKISNNKLHCDCHTIYELYRATRNGTLFARCTSPTEYENKNINELIFNEKQICNNHNRLCGEEYRELFNESPKSYEELCRKDGSKLPVTKIIVTAVSLLLLISFILILYLCLRLHRLRRSVKLEELDDIPNVVCNDAEFLDRALSTPVQADEVVFVEKNLPVNDNTAIQLTKLKTPGQHRSVFNFDRRFSCDSEGSLNSGDGRASPCVKLNEPNNNKTQKPPTQIISVIITEPSDVEDN